MLTINTCFPLPGNKGLFFFFFFSSIKCFKPEKWSHSVVSRLFVTPWTVAHQAPQSMEFSRQEYWSGLPFPVIPNSCHLRNSRQKIDLFRFLTLMLFHKCLGVLLIVVF